MVDSVKEIMYGYLACPRCHHSLKGESGPGHEDDGQLTCVNCGGRFPVVDAIPELLTEGTKEHADEGIAVDLKNAIALFKKEIDPDQTRSERLFDEDLVKRDLVFLDVGCGIGRHLLVLRNNDMKTVMGFDLVPELVRLARDEYGLSNLFVANALNIPLKDGSVDRCLLYNAIEHCSDPERVLRELHRVLRKDGVLYMDVPNARSMGDRIFRWGGIIFYGKTSHIQKFTFRKIQRLVESIGFEIEKHKKKRGIFIEYPQLQKFGFVKTMFRTLFGNEVSGWELKLRKRG